MNTTTNDSKRPRFAGISTFSLTGFDWRRDLVTVYFCVLFASFFVLGSDGLRTIMYIGIPILLNYIYQNHSAVRFRNMVWYIAFGLIGYFLINYISIAWSEPADVEKLFQRLKMLAIFPLILLPFALKAREPDGFWSKCLSAYALSAIVTAVLLMLFNIEGIINNDRLHGWGRAHNPVQCGLLYGVAFLLIVFCRHKLFFFKDKPAWVAYVLSLLPLAVMILSQSRGPFLAMAAIFAGMILLNLIYHKKISIRLFLCMVGLMVVGVITFLCYGSAVTFERGSTGRVDIWKHAITLIEEKPVLGHGIATKFHYKYNYNQMIEYSGHPHNIYLSALVHTGIVGLILQMFAMIGAIYMALMRHCKEHDPSYLIVIGFGALLGFVDFGGYYTNLGSTWIVFWFPLAAMLFFPAKPREEIHP